MPADESGEQRHRFDEDLGGGGGGGGGERGDSNTLGCARGRTPEGKVPEQRDGGEGGGGDVRSLRGRQHRGKQRGRRRGRRGRARKAVRVLARGG